MLVRLDSNSIMSSEEGIVKLKTQNRSNSSKISNSLQANKITGN